MPWAGQNRTIRSHADRQFTSRFRERLYTEDEVEWEGKLSAAEAMATSLRVVTAPSTSQDASKSRRLAHLNALVKIWSKRETEEDEDGLRLQEIMLCLRIPLINESTEIRAATLRTLRHLLRTSESAQAITTLNIHYLISRCLDIELDNKIERLQALKLCRSLAFVQQGQYFPMILLKSLVAIAEEGKSKDDRYYRAALGLLCEISVVHPLLFIEAGGVKTLTYCLLDTSMSKIAEAILSSLLRLHNDPVLRWKANVNLGVIVAPFTEFNYIHQFKHNNQADKIEALEEREKRFKCAEQAFLSTMRSWSGLIQLCQPRLVGPSHLQAVIDIMYLKNNQVRQYLINMFFEMLNLRAPPPKSTFSDALRVADPSTFKDSWKLADGFVASEGLDILPHISKSRPNLVENHLSLILHCLLKCDLPDALVKVIVDTEELSLSVSATILLGELLHLANQLLPREVNVISHCLPGLLREVSSLDLKRATRAQEAVAALQKLHAIKKRGPKANSLFLDQILSSSGTYSGECFVGDRLHWTNFLKAYNDEKLKANIKLSSVNINYDANVWDWDLVTAIFKSPVSDAFKALEVPDYKNFVRRIMEYFKPTNGRFCRLELSNPQSRVLARTACYLFDFLVEAASSEADRILDEYLKDFQDCLNSLIQSQSASSGGGDCLLAPTKVATTGCQYFFLFIGRLSKSPRGRQALDKYSILGHFTELLGMRSDLYLKLVISCLDYSCMEWGSRVLLSKALKEGSETCRIYATKFLGVLMRSRANNVAQWGLELITSQLFDKESKIVPIVAVNILDEAADDKMNLEAMVCALQNKDLSHLGTRGKLLKTRLLVSSTYGTKIMNNEDQLDEFFHEWKSHLNEEYVIFTEDLINDGLTKHQRDDDLSYGRRTFEAHSLRPAFIPYHFYGQLANSKQGMEALIRHPDIHDILAQLANAGETNWNRVKSAIWSVANVCISHEGVCFIDREGGIDALIRIAEKSPVLSLKGTAFFALSLVATTRYGCHVLASKGWCTLKYSRGDPWPVLEDWFLRFQLATLLDQDGYDSNPEDNMDDLKRRSASLQCTPLIQNETDENDDEDSQLPPRSSSLSSRKRLSNLFKSFSDKKDGSGSLTRRIRRSLFKGSPVANADLDETDFYKDIPLLQHQDSIEEGGKAAPIATPERSKSSSGETLEEIKEEHDTKLVATNPCTTESSTTSSLPPATNTSSIARISPTSAVASKPPRFKIRSGQRAYSESEAQSFLQSNLVTSVVPGASITSMASTGSYTDNPGYLTLRSIHSRHRPVLDFIETGDDHEHAPHAQEIQNMSESFGKTRHPSGSVKRMSMNRKRLLAPLKDEDLSKTINDRYWGITLPAKIDNLVNDGTADSLSNDGFYGGQISTPPSPVTFEYHSEENCLKCFNYLDTPVSGTNMSSRHRSSSLTCSSGPMETEVVLANDKAGTKSTIGSPINLRKQLCKKPGGSHHGQDLELAKQRLEQRKEALKVISTLNATVGASRTEDILLKMKQQCPVIFKDLCFYSEVCQLMSHFSFRLSSRRFIQELFMDVNFEVLAEDARTLLAAHKNPIDNGDKPEDNTN